MPCILRTYFGQLELWVPSWMRLIFFSLWNSNQNTFELLFGWAHSRKCSIHFIVNSIQFRFAHTISFAFALWKFVQRRHRNIVCTPKRHTQYTNATLTRVLDIHTQTHAMNGHAIVGINTLAQSMRYVRIRTCVSRGYIQHNVRIQCRNVTIRIKRTLHDAWTFARHTLIGYNLQKRCTLSCCVFDGSFRMTFRGKAMNWKFVWYNAGAFGYWIL